MECLKPRLQFGILSFENPYPLIPGFEVSIKGIDDPQMFLVHLLGPSVLSQDPLGG